jgi:hypothetical protein
MPADTKIEQTTQLRRRIEKDEMGEADDYSAESWR